MNREQRRRERKRQGRSRRIIGASIVAIGGLSAGYLQVLRQAPVARAAAYCGAGHFGVIDDTTFNNAIADFNNGGCDNISIGANFTLHSSIATIDMTPVAAGDFLTIQGNHYTINGGTGGYGSHPKDGFRPFEVSMNSADYLMFSQLTLTWTSSTDDAAKPAGGAISVNPNAIAAGEVHLFDVDVFHSDAYVYLGGGVYERYQGGAVYLNDDTTSIEQSSFSYGTAGVAGGGAWITSSDVTIYDTNFSHNQAGDSTSAGYGGGLYLRNRHSDEVPDISYGAFIANRAYGSGGGVFVGQTYNPQDSLGNLNVYYTSFTDNRAFEDQSMAPRHASRQYGGALAFAPRHESGPNANYGYLNIYQSTFTDNYVGDPYHYGKELAGGGGVYSAGRTTLSGTTFDGNKAYMYAPGDDTTARGGAILATGRLFVTHSRMTHNRAGGGQGNGDGGAIFTSGTPLLKVYYSTFDHNGANDEPGGGVVAGFGGAIASSAQDVKAYYSSLYANQSAGGYGGALYAYNSHVSLYNSFVGSNSALGAGGIHSVLSDVRLLFSTVYDDTVASALYPSDVSVNNGSLTAVGSVIGSHSSGYVVGTSSATVDDTYSVSTQTTHAPLPLFTGYGSQNTTPGTLAMGSLDYTGGTPGQEGRSPAGTSVLVTDAPLRTAASSWGVLTYTYPTRDQVHVNRTGDSHWTIGARQVTPTATAPGAPSAVSATAGDGQATVSWTAPSNGGSPILNYRVYRGLSASGPWVLDDTVSAGTLSKAVTGLLNGTAYWFQVKATNAIGTGLPGTTATSVTPQSPPVPPAPGVPSAPRDVVGVAGDRRAVVSWAAPASSGSFPVTTYQVVASPGGGQCLADAPTLSCEVSGLANGTTYTFTVRALNGAGWSPDSAASNAVTPQADPTPPGPEPVPAPLPPGRSSLMVDGQPAPGLTVDPNARSNGLDISGPGFTMTLAGLGPDGKPLPLSDDSVLEVVAGQQASSTGTGFAPGSTVAVYVDPGEAPVASRAWHRAHPRAVQLGTLKVNGGGAFDGTVAIPDGLPLGDHVLQAVGYAADGKVRAVSIGIRVVPSGAKSIMITGSRSGGRARVKGSTSNIASPTVKPRYHFAAEARYKTGVSRPPIDTSGNFTWQRQANRKIYVYFAADGVRSNRVIIQAT